MSRLSVFALRVRGLFGRRGVENQLDEELRFHLEMEAEENVRNGVDPEEARYAAMREFGGVERVKEQCRETSSFAALDSGVRDLRYAARALLKNRGFTAVAVMTLAIGIGMNGAVFTIAKAALFAGFPMVERNDRILYLSSGRGCCVSYPDFEDWRARAKSFSGMAIVHGTGRTVTDGSGFAESHDATEVSADTFRLVGAKPMLGRDFASSDEIPGAPPVAILSYNLWERRFGGNPSLVGKTVRMNGIPATVIGIMPRGFSFPQKQDLWVPLVVTPEVRKRGARDMWFAFGRLAEGATMESARAEMEIIGRRLGAEYPLTNQGRNLLPVVQTFNQFFFFGNENAVYWSMWGAVGFVLLIACANLANLMLARAMLRGREISVRMALGAGRWRIVRQLLMESMMLSAVGGVVGACIAYWGVRAWQLADKGFPVGARSPWRIVDYSMDYRVLGYLIAISVGTAFVFGLAPARRLFRLDVNAMLKDGGRGSTDGVRGKSLSRLLVIGEMALAVVLLAGAGVMVRSFLKVYNADLGVHTANLLTVGISLPKTRYAGAEEQISFYDRARTALEALPGVESAAIVNNIPSGTTFKAGYELAGEDKNGDRLSGLAIGPKYFDTLAAPVLAGRQFSDSDGPETAVAIVNQRFANQHWPGESSLGKRLRLMDGKTSGPWLTVVGLAPDIAQDGIFTRNAIVYVPYRQRPGANMQMMARTRVTPASLIPAFRRVFQKLDPELPVYGPVTLDERLETSYWTPGIDGALFAVLGFVALLLAGTGLYAVIAHSVSRRTQEIGIRMAIGGTAADIRGLVFRQGMLPLAVGLGIGLCASFGVNRALRSLLVQVAPADPVAFGITSLVLIVAGLLGCWVPACRAMRVDPVVALRHE